MNQRPRHLVILGLLAVLAAAGCTVTTDADAPPAPTTTASGVVPMRVVQDQGRALAFVPVTIAGQGPFLFALDTGASASIVDTDIVERLKLPSTGEQRPVTGIIGTERVDLVRVTDWAVGGITLDPLEIASIDLPDVNGGVGLQGLLGSDVLSDFGRITIDYQQQQLELGVE